MNTIFLNPDIVQRFDELIKNGEQLAWGAEKTATKLLDPIRLTRWATSSLNLLDKLSVSTNRFVREFERYGHVNEEGVFNVGLALGVLQSARDEYLLGLAVEYHLSVSAAVFGGLLDEAKYLLEKSYLRAAMVLIGAALEEGLKTRAKQFPALLGGKETLTPIIHKLKASDIGVLNEFQAKELEAVGVLRNKAAHGEEFDCSKDEIEKAKRIVEDTLHHILTGDFS